MIKAYNIKQNGQALIKRSSMVSTPIGCSGEGLNHI